MWVDILLASLWGGIVALDTTAVLQIMVSRPMVACSIIGLILGNFQLGFTIGILLELLYISELPVGGANFAESNVGSAAAAAIAILTVRQFPDRVNIIIAGSLLLAAIISWCGGKLVRLMRRINSRVYDSILKKELITPWHINLGQFYGITLAFMLGFSCVFLSALVFAGISPMILEQAPLKVDQIMHPAIGGLLAAGCIFLVHLFWTQGERRRLLAVGVVIGVILILGGL